MLDLPQCREHHFVLQDTPDNCYQTIRLDLEQRGWKGQTYSESLERSNNRFEPDLYWTLDERSIEYDRLLNSQIANHFKDIASVTTKCGLTRSMQSLHWCTSGAAADSTAYFPRSYSLDNCAARAAFVDDFKRTAASAVLKKAVATSYVAGTQRNPIPQRLIELALRVCSCWLDELEAKPCKLDSSTTATSVLNDTEWQELLEFSYQVLEHPQETNCVQKSGDAMVSVKVNQQTLPTPRSRKVRQNISRPSSASMVGQNNARQRDSSVLAAGVRSLRELGRRKAESACNRCDDFAFSVLPRQTEERSSDESMTSNLDVLRQVSNSVVRRLSTLWPQWEIDGTRNIWVVKAPEACRGHGIVLRRRLDQILTLADRMTGRVVQKYVENPLTWREPSSPETHNRTISSPALDTPAKRYLGVKFDLRLWCLFVCDKECVETYLYEPCYARLCSQQFSLDDDSMNNPCVHLSNLAVQRRENFDSGHSMDRDLKLMRTQRELELQLENLGTSTDDTPTKWSTAIRPKLARIISGLTAAVVHHASPRVRSFELVGVDVLLDEHATPWLLEVNLSPALARRSSGHANTIANMLGGVLHRTVDKWFPLGIPSRFDTNIDGWTLMCRYNTPPATSQRCARTSNMIVDCKKLGRKELRLLDETLRQLHAWNILRKWWKYSNSMRAERRWQQVHAQGIIARLFRRQYLRRMRAVRRVQDEWHAFRAIRSARSVITRRKLSIILVQTFFRQRLAAFMVQRILQIRRNSAKRISRVFMDFYLKRLLGRRTSVIQHALEAAQVSLVCACAAVTFATAVATLVNFRQQKFLVQRESAAIKLQSITRARIACLQVKEKRRFKILTGLARRIQCKVRSHLKLRATSAKVIQIVLRKRHARRQHSFEHTRAQAAMYLQKKFRELSQEYRSSVLNKLMTCAVNAKLGRLIIASKTKVSTPDSLPRLMEVLRPIDYVKPSIASPETACFQPGDSASPAGEVHLVSVDESSARVSSDTPSASVGSAKQSAHIGNTADFHGQKFEKQFSSRTDVDPFLVEISRFRSRVIASPYDAKLRWKPSQHQSKKHRIHKFSPASISTRSRSGLTGAMIRRRRLKKPTIVPGRDVRHLTEFPTSQEDCSTMLEIESWMWAGSPRAIG